jgi:methylene-fatty-acyl-phospholipid synthase
MELRSRPVVTSQVGKAESSPSDSPKEVTRPLLKGTAVTASGVEVRRSGRPKNDASNALQHRAHPTARAPQVPLDVERRKSAKAEDNNNGVDRPLQLLCIAGMLLPLVWAVLTQQGPTVGEQLTEWATVSWAQFTDGKINPNFQIAVAALFIERLCYTWVHTFSASFVKFTKTALGAPPDARTQAQGVGESAAGMCRRAGGSAERSVMGTRGQSPHTLKHDACPCHANYSPRPPDCRTSPPHPTPGKRMGKKPLDVVLSIFWINKCIQLGTFALWYFYVIGFVSPLAAGFSLASRTRLQWVMLAQGAVAGQGLNLAIYRAIGKRGVYYGYRLGEEVPWVTGFPFSVMSHPQYSGVCLSVLGTNAFMATPTHLAAGWLNLTAIQILLYVYMGLVEDYM